MSNSAVKDVPVTIIKPRKGWQVVDFGGIEGIPRFILLPYFA